MSYGIKRISSWTDDVRSGVYQIRVISKVAVYGGKTVGPDASLWIILEIRGRWGTCFGGFSADSSQSIVRNNLLDPAEAGRGRQ